MRIGIDIRALMEGKTTGVQIYVTHLLHALFQLDQVNQYFLFANSFADIKERVQVFDYPNAKYKIFRYPNKLFILGQKFLASPKLDRMLGGIDLFFSPHWRTAALPANLPLVITFHDLSFEIMPEFFTLRQRLWHQFMNYREAAHRASLLVAVSHSTQQDLVRFYGIPEKKIRVIYPGVALSSLPEAVPLSDLPERYFLAFGTFEPRKNLEAVLAAYREYFKKSKVKLPLVLAGSSGWKTKLAIPAPIGKFVKVLENVTEEEKSFLYRRAFALLFLSFYEGFGFPVLEAASQGVPVIGSFATSVAEVGSDFVLLVNPFRSSQIAEAMLSLEEDEPYRLRLRDRALAASSRFSWTKSAEEMLNLFEGLMK